MQQIVPVILAGGSGTRLWPLSRALYPKQFLALAGPQTLFQQAVLRLVALGDDYKHHLGCQWHVLALHRLGRDAEALASLRTALEAMWNSDSADAVRAVPWNVDGDPPLVERKPADEAFEAACYALMVELQPDNVFAWAAHARTARSASERKAALEAWVKNKGSLNVIAQVGTPR